MVGLVLVFPAVSVVEPCALRKPLAVARTVYVPAGAVRLKVPSTLAVTEAATELSALSKLTVTGLPASTCPVSAPEPAGNEVGVGDPIGVEVDVAVGDSIGVEVKVAVGDSTGVDENVGVDVGISVNHI